MCIAVPGGKPYSKAYDNMDALAKDVKAMCDAMDAALNPPPLDPISGVSMVQ